MFWTGLRWLSNSTNPSLVVRLRREDLWGVVVSDLARLEVLDSWSRDLLLLELADLPDLFLTSPKSLSCDGPQ